MSGPIEWPRVRALFEAALGVPDRERIDFLARTCGTDAELLRAVVELLASDHRSNRFLRDRPGARLRSPPSDSEAAGG